MKDKFLFLVPNPDSIAYLLMRYNLEGKGRMGIWTRVPAPETTLTLQIMWDLMDKYWDMRDLVFLYGILFRLFRMTKNKTIYESMVKDNLMPDNESYLVAYIVHKGKNELLHEEEFNQIQRGIEPELYFA